MPENKRKFKPQNLIGLINESKSTASQKELRDSSSPSPAGRRPGTLTSASGQYKLSALKGQSPGWSGDETRQDKPESRQSTPPNSGAKGTKMDFNWDEEDEWDPAAHQMPKPSKEQASSGDATPWAAPKASTAADLSSTIKNLKQAPTSQSSSIASRAPRVTPRAAVADGQDALRRFRLHPTENDANSRELMSAPRHQGREFGRDFSREPPSRFGSRFDHHDSHDDLDWNSGRQTNTMRRESFGREPLSHDRTAAPQGLRPLHTQTQESHSLRPLNSAKKVQEEDEATKQKKAQEEIEQQKELMHLARQKALEARLEKERKEEEEKQQRLKERLAALDAKKRESAEKAKAEEGAKGSQRSTDQNHQKEHRDREHARKEAERRHAEELKERAMEESWSARKQSGGQPLSSMRRKERPARDSTPKSDTGSTASAGSSTNGNNKPVSSSTPIEVSFPNYENVEPCKDPLTVVGKFPAASEKFHSSERESAMEIRVLFPTLK